MTKLVKFNIGGQRYEVSRSLLQLHPHSVLAKSATDQWQEDPEAEIFIEGDGSLFRHILHYLRHGSVCLPITESKKTFMKELEYYGIDADEDAIDDTVIQKAKGIEALTMAMADLQAYVVKSHADYRHAQLALDCIRYYVKDSVPYGNGKPYNVLDKLKQDPTAMKNFEALLSLSDKGGNVWNAIQEGVNVNLRIFGLRLSLGVHTGESNWGFSHTSAQVQKIVIHRHA